MKNKRELFDNGQNLKELLLNNDGEFLVAFKRVIGPLYSMSIIIPYIAWAIILWRGNLNIYGNFPAIFGDIVLMGVLGVAMFLKYCIREEDEMFSSRIQCPLAASLFMVLSGIISLLGSRGIAAISNTCLGEGELILLPMVMNLCLKALVSIWMWGLIAPTEEASVIKEKIKNEQVIIKAHNVPTETEKEPVSKKTVKTEKKTSKVATEEADDETVEECPNVKKKEAELAAAFLAGEEEKSA